MNDQHPEIELYINAGNDEQNTAVQQLLDALELDQVVHNTLLAAGVRQAVMLTLLVTDDEGIQDLNNQYRQQNKPTDVLSFPLLEKPLVTAPAEQLWMTEVEGEREEATGADRPAFVTPPELITNLGDIIVSWPAALRQAEAAGHAPDYELLYLIAHGVLHLVGYDDQREAGYHKMVALQQSVLEAAGRRA
ncbi:MAG TPA: rRNA maturation RNase YbeY [Ktedonobacteraceae bacterium]|nr:rRNA maturation RNase YbeY [Ktedonobacteraceae bacterium]